MNNLHFCILQALSQSWYFFFRALFKCFSALVVNAVVTPVFLAVIFPVVAGYIILQRFFLATSRYVVYFVKKWFSKNFSFPWEIPGPKLAFCQGIAFYLFRILC